jgi:hypothetical protein
VEFYGMALMLLAALMKIVAAVGIELLLFCITFLEIWIEACL